MTLLLSSLGIGISSYSHHIYLQFLLRPSLMQHLSRRRGLAYKSRCCINSYKLQGDHRYTRSTCHSTVCQTRFYRTALEMVSFQFSLILKYLVSPRRPISNRPICSFLLLFHIFIWDFIFLRIRVYYSACRAYCKVQFSEHVYKPCNAGRGPSNLEARHEERFWRVFHQEKPVILFCGNWTVSEIFLNTALFERAFIPIIIMNSIFLNSLIAKVKMPRIQHHLLTRFWYQLEIYLVSFSKSFGNFDLF